eukprot:UN26112
MACTDVEFVDEQDEEIDDQENNLPVSEEISCVDGSLVHVITIEDGINICREWCHKSDWCNGELIQNICLCDDGECENELSCLHEGKCAVNGFEVPKGPFDMNNNFVVKTDDNVSQCDEYDSALQIYAFQPVCECVGEPEGSEGGQDCLSNFQGHHWCYVESGTCSDSHTTENSEREWSF